VSSRLDVLANSSRGKDVEQDGVPQIKTVFWAAVSMSVVPPQQSGEIDEMRYGSVLPGAFVTRQLQLLLEVSFINWKSLSFPFG